LKSNRFFTRTCWLIIFLGVLTSAIALPASQNSQTTIQTRSGAILGTIGHDVLVFKGIPFAQPPVGALRWRPPQPVKPWEGVRSATEWGPVCMQERKIDPGIGPGEPSENCLTLNVFEPAATKALHPVMVFFYGGGFTQGSASAAIFDGTYLAQQGVVIVTCNYRLGRLGFFAHPALTKEANGDLVANYGLMDQIAALKWVRDNIAAFGGDAGKVTIFGESAGGISVNNLMISPLARGLFHAAIAESSFGRERTETLAEAEKSGIQEARRWGVTSETVEALRQVPAGSIIAVDAKDQPFSCFLDGHVPIIDGQVVPESVVNGFSAGHEAAVPFIIGVNELELPPAFPPPSLESRAPLYSQLPPELRTQYASEEDFKNNFLSEAVLAEPASLIAAYHARRAPTFVYRFGIASDALLEHLTAAPHGSELPYIFQTYGSAAFPMGPRDALLGQTFAAYWIDFGKTQDPNGSGRPVWPKFKNAMILTFTNTGPVPRPDPLATRLRAITAGYANGTFPPLIRSTVENDRQTPK
jgi:para-nitrobenzyl esterase